MCAARSETEEKHTGTQAKTSQHAATHSNSTDAQHATTHTVKSTTHNQQATTHTGKSAGGGSAPVQHTQAPHQQATTNGRPQSGGAGTRPTGLKSHSETAGGGAAKPAASAPPAPVYHYNFRTKSGVIGRDFTRPLTPEEQTAIAREAEKGQPKGTQGAHGGDESENGAYHYNFPTKSGVIGRDFTRPLTPEEQSAIARQVANGQREGTKAAPGGYQYDNGVYHYNFPTKSGLIGRDFTKPLTPDEQSAIARQVENGPPEGTQVRAVVAPTQKKTNALRPQHFNLPTKSNPKIAGAKFEGTGHIPGSEAWTDPRYAPFRNYHHEWHDADWWKHHHTRIVFVFGGWYYWNARYWFPAWGYNRSSAYMYDGPIYAFNNLEPDQVVANVQAALQGLGYYHGSINGFLDSATRAAIATYQQDHGLYMTSAIDEATLAALEMS